MAFLKIPFDTHTQYAALLGRLVGHWAVAEQELTFHFANVLGVERSRGKLVWDSFIALPPKIELMERICHQEGVATEYQQGLMPLLTEARSCNGQRTKFVHAVYGEVDGKDIVLMSNALERDTRKTHKPQEQLSVEGVEAVIRRISQLTLALQQLRDKIGR